MDEIKKHCDTCRYSFDKMEENHFIPEGVRMQHCSSYDYNSSGYTHEMCMEDWPNGCCRFWAPKIKEESSL